MTNPAADYDDSFFDHVTETACSSANVIIELLLQQLSVNSVLDVGCGRGAWLSVWHQKGVERVRGIDGDYVKESELLIDAQSFVPSDLSKPKSVALEESFDLVQCLEVAEHLPASAADDLVEFLTSRGKVVLFSAATPGQGGLGHVNEQPHRYWLEKFVGKDFHVFDFLRSHIDKDERVAPWYRHNIFLCVHQSLMSGLPSPIKERDITSLQEVADYRDASTKIMHSILAKCPLFVVDLLSRLKHRLVA